MLLVCATAGCKPAPSSQPADAGPALAQGVPSGVAAPLPVRLPAGNYEPANEPSLQLQAQELAALRERALASAQVWQPPIVPIERADLRNPGDMATPTSLVCRFLPTQPTGTTPKFQCVLAGGAVIKVKYGRNPEIPAEVAASRLLLALGFGADDVSIVPVVRCFGCPPSPFEAMRVMGKDEASHLNKAALDMNAFTDFENAAIERPYERTAIVTKDVKGWAWWELEKVNPAMGGAPRAHLDALRLLAVFLAHWDNKSENQRLVCLDDTRSCRRSFALINDLGATFGPKKADLDGWHTTPVWADPVSCTASMARLPHGGATFKDVRISEEGRRFLAEPLSRLSLAQIRDLFVGAQFAEHQPFYNSAAGRHVENWVEVFREKVRQIAERAPCPSSDAPIVPAEGQ